MVKFITEEYLRELYRKKPFNIYKLEQEQRLTPGAVEYLSDKKIKISKDTCDNFKDILKANIKTSQDIQADTTKEEENRNLNFKKRLCYKLKSIEAKFLVTTSEILKEDVILAQGIMNLNRKIANITNVVDGKDVMESISFKECTGMNLSNFTTEIGDCFEITEFHMQLKKSNAILKMNTLRCMLRELQFEIFETYKDDDLKNTIIANVNSIINSLSQLICLAVGGKECQRKI
ncbi:ATP--cob(I)alamin adenosyltransferase [Clostridium botulinum]|uniref:ATP:cob(I)alamin adenosyltransferase n=1 Tax=Clostridium botulinum C/D str. DC5 TaxID=1443128 RepID=A0A0A0IMN1_CLOBO|nr:ATP--cob(I)alamin adenosyltransferase [Clostridium botulinum]KEI00840.1 ATP:cob(I)alamin adenosyltransferase [Clostridium botulinum C/D str. BKT75002]KEI09154.1 ATP:cob(I)alamin adenosyltransferase [Clostridium botulinum C/D str. BKT2873]KGM96217.1 ATP:cob(I)alamin adenosyltransferase [Clostridium botulinum D str. CCUG 7971]KGN00791.1 ATP:cob(I)alamin adenosyltransferase [Clostridium botulinum C/D str. DC5]KOC46226.1 cobalamin adenosyltransferase [Clostridium botulinum]